MSDDVAVLDTSAYLAMINLERGAEVVTRALRGAMISAVNIAEVQTKLVSRGMTAEIASWHIDVINCECVPFERELARITGSLIRLTKPYGLSLGDRACLALGIDRKATVYTADRAWKELDLDVEIVLIR